jgi:hypothetical protein
LTQAESRRARYFGHAIRAADDPSRTHPRPTPFQPFTRPFVARVNAMTR